MRTAVKNIIGPVIQKLHRQWLKKPRRYAYKDISVWVEPGVFPPFLTLSTKILLDFIEPMPLAGKRFLELGCGCGIISVMAARKGAIVTASDINRMALDSLRRNSADNEVELEIVYSDLFAELGGRNFDYIVINPPYYPKTPHSEAEHAWFCGEDFGYFRKMFAQLPNHLTTDNFVYMILSEDCAIKTIQSLAKTSGVAFELALEKTVAGEKNYLFRLVQI